MPDVGDLVTARLTVSPADVTTGVSLVVTRPDGSTVTPVVTGSDGGAAWTAPVTYTLAGIWRLSWTVTGTGASVEHELVSVAPAPAVGPQAHVYASTTQLANYLHAAAPLDSPKQLAEASKALDDALLTAVYDTDDDGMPTSATVAEAFAEAVCAIVEWWGETGDAIGADSGWDTVSAGPVALGRSSGGSTATPIAAGALPPRAAAALSRLPSCEFQTGVTSAAWPGMVLPSW
ncbi:hypothetical protein OHB41_20935 [Streptomyces sp. NBC_01571]|uniref:hypothetical protein n=1 Tax=Streptomyces sp. NBC_01571 TaxID=2975883 RepID=UPI00225A971C|nr:hypothetical protein [Streptomyces sp. NBC_01571]MCX4575609.1 hypothetical protein [Streptomyces sp. NBC_01571]